MPVVTPEIKRELLDGMAAVRPDLWQKCYPRIYADAPGSDYASPREIAADMLGAIARVEQGYMGDNEKAEAVWAANLVRYRVPTYWISRDLAEALKRTTPPQTLDLKTMHLPWEAATFMLPKGVLVHPGEEGDAVFVSYSRTTKGKTIYNPGRGNPEEWTIMENGTFTVFVHTRIEHLLHWTLPDYLPVNLSQLDEIVQKFHDGGEWKTHRSAYPMFVGSPNVGDMTDDDNRFMAVVLHFVLGVLVLMLARPDLVEDAALQKRVMKKNEAPKEFWSPARIGKNYKMRRAPSPYQGGTHASPRIHCVKGYYKPKLGERLGREVWIEPYWRGEG